MITSNGKIQIQRFLALQSGTIGGSLALGVGTKAAALNDTALEYEVIRMPIASVNTDPSSGNLVFRAQFEPGSIKTVYEIGLWSSPLLDDVGYTLSILSDSPLAWSNGTLTSSNARANTNAVQVSYSANGTTNAELSGFVVDASNFTDADSIVFAYHATVNLSSLRVRMGTDSSNYYEFVMPAHTANSYNIARISRSTATKTGSPSWSNIAYLAVRPSATAAGGGNIFFDGIRFEKNSLAVDNLLVARSVLSTPYSLDPDIPSDVEYSLKVSVS